MELTLPFPPAPGTHVTVDLRTEPHPPRRARRALRELISRRHRHGPHTQDLTESALLVVSELVTNACRHTPGPVEMRLLWTGPDLVIQVDDRSQERPALTPHERRDERGGYGLALIEDLAAECAVAIGPCGKTIQVTLRTQDG